MIEKIIIKNFLEIKTRVRAQDVKKKKIEAADGLLASLFKS